MPDYPTSSRIPKAVFQQPLFQDQLFAADLEQMRHQITSTKQLELAYRAIEPEVPGLNIQITQADARQILDLYNKTVLDGRFLAELLTDPAAVAAKLGSPLSPAGVAALKKAGTLRVIQTLLHEEAFVPFVGVVAVVGIVVIGVVLVVDPMITDRVVIDSSGTVKM